MSPFDWLCLCSLIGIWPRWIEPNLLCTSRHRVQLQTLPPPLEGLRIAHLSDLHLSPSVRYSYSDRLVARVAREKPDLIVLTGDFLSFGRLHDGERLSKLLNRFSAPLGCFAIPGNHDYAQYPTRQKNEPFSLKGVDKFAVRRALEMLRDSAVTEPARWTEEVAQLPIHSELLAILKDSPFRLLHNECVSLERGGAAFQLVGLGDYWLGRCNPATAFAEYDPTQFGIVLTHNPDTFDQLREYPGELLLAGHTHGCQINLPWIGRKLAALEDPNHARGWVRKAGKQMYVSRGLGAGEPFRIFSPPELACHTLVCAT